MSNYPRTLTLPERPPFRGGPPIRTTFDGGDSGSPEPEYELYLESAERLLKTVDSWQIESLPVLLRLLAQRQRWLKEQYWSLKLFSAPSLPPVGGFDLEDVFEPSDELEARLSRMLDRVDEAIQKVNLRLDMQKCPFPLSEL